MKRNLETLIREHAATMAEQMVKVSKWAQSEEDLRHECNKLIDEFLKKTTLKIKGQHEYGLAGGRIDSKYGGVIIEYKDPKGSGKLTEDRTSPGVKAVVRQITQRFKDFQKEENIEAQKIFAAGCDGDTFVFVRHRGKQLEVEDPLPVTPHTVERLLRAIVSLGAKGYSFTPDNLCGHFGADGNIAELGIRQIYNVICETDNPKAQTFFKQWQILFSEVCGYDVHGQNPKIRKLGDHYHIPDALPAELLFSVHTYYGILIKLLAAEIVSSFSPLGTSTLKRLVGAATSAKLRSELESLEQGGIWSQLGIRNFLEGDLFSWYLDAWDDRCAETIREMVQTLDQYDPATLSVEPAESRDLLKNLYQHLFPKSVRHDLGEYYTPDWLAELVLNELGYDGDPDKRLLDPACGSGTFLVMTINRIKSWFDEHRHECGFGETELLQKILSNVIGFDLNPLAVMAARTNYLLAIRDLLRHGGDIELPIYLCDSIMTPSEYGTERLTSGKKKGAEAGADLWLGYKTHRLKTAAGDFFVPIEIAKDRGKLAKYADALEFCVRNEFSADDFIARCEKEDLPVSEERLHRDLYGKLRELDADNQNGIWARIIKNAFAPLFVDRVDYVAGNPPWVNWENLPDDYRQSTAPLWQEYDLFRHKGYKAKLGGGKDDVSILMTYVAHDAFLAEGGRLGFVITQTVFKTVGGGEGFRSFEYEADGTKWYLPPLAVHDLSDFQPFEGATNRTAVIIVGKKRCTFSYPVPYTVWKKTAPGKIASELELNEVREATARTKLAAQPVRSQERTSPWLTAPKQALSGIQKVIGQSDYKAYEGVNTGGLNGCYWIRVLEKRSNGELLIENLHDVGKIKVSHVQTVIEPDLVYPLLRGRDVQRWHAEPSAHIILANRTDKLAGIPESEMKRRWPKTYAYLKQFEGDPQKPVRGTLRGRSGYRQYFKPSDPFYSMYNVGPYTMAKWKVVWPWISKGMRVAVSGPLSSQVTIPEHNASFCSFQAKDQAYFLCALLSCAAVDLAIRSFYSGGGGGIASPEVVKSINLPPYDPKSTVHNTLTSLSGACASACQDGTKESAISGLEAEIDEVAAKIWDITDAELKAIQKALADM